MGATVATPRESALRFTEGVRSGWLTSDLLTWMQEDLVRPGRLVLSDGHQIREVREHGFGAVVLRPTGSHSPRYMTASHVPQLLEMARHRVVSALRTSIESSQPSFANAALYSGRVVRDKRTGGRSVWQVKLTEATALSDQVLALFAADLLEHPLDYESELSVCDSCGQVSLISMPGGCRRGCPAHPFGGAKAMRIVCVEASGDRF